MIQETKEQIATIIKEIIKREKLTQKKAAALLEIDQPKISNILNLKLRSHSLEKLLRFVNYFGYDVNIIANESRRKVGNLSVYIEDKEIIRIKNPKPPSKQYR